MRYILIALFLFFTSCEKKQDIITNKEIKCIKIYEKEENNNPLIIRDSDSIQEILKKINNNRREIIKFRPKFLMKVIYKNNQHKIVFINEKAIKIDNITYRTGDNIIDSLVQ
ncbi:hypothetical protein [Flavobacterium beibuense]|nr:hypothetical protein [Flavobacterium beibuense]